MKKYLPLFPLDLVAYPGEKLNLHIFEPRYRELLKDCLEQNQTFGIPSYVKKTLEWGTEMRIVEVEKMYEDGRADIRTEGVQVFEILSYQNPAEGKLYAGGEVKLHQDNISDEEESRNQMHKLVKELYETMELVGTVHVDNEVKSFNVAHRIGLSKKQEYKLLKMTSEKERQSFIIEHLEHVIPILKEAERTKSIVRMNGHFRHYDPLNF
jgi:Lon protease-like protein